MCRMTREKLRWDHRWSNQRSSHAKPAPHLAYRVESSCPVAASPGRWLNVRSARSNLARMPGLTLPLLARPPSAFLHQEQAQPCTVQWRWRASSGLIWRAWVSALI